MNDNSNSNDNNLECNKIQCFDSNGNNKFISCELLASLIIKYLKN